MPQCCGRPRQMMFPIVADARTNALLVRHPVRRACHAVRQLVVSLDRPGAGGNIHVVPSRTPKRQRLPKPPAVLSATPPALRRNPTGHFPLRRTPAPPPGRPPAARPPGTPAVTSGGGIIQADALQQRAYHVTAPEAIYNNLRHVMNS